MEGGAGDWVAERWEVVLRVSWEGWGLKLKSGEGERWVLKWQVGLGFRERRDGGCTEGGEERMKIEIFGEGRRDGG